MINRFLIMLCVLCISWGVKAHQPDLSSTILVEQGENKWVLQIRAALTAFEYEIEQTYGKDSYETPEEFQDLVIKHVQEHISILYNKANTAVLQNGKVKLGHETSDAQLRTPTPLFNNVTANSSNPHTKASTMTNANHTGMSETPRMP